MFRLTTCFAVLAFLAPFAAAQEKEKQRGQSVAGMLTKVDAISITIARRGDAGVKEDTFKLVATTKVLIETAEDDTVKGEGGRERKVPKTKEGKTADLKTGQRVQVTANASGEALTIRVLRAAKVRPKEGDR
jgi:hypothetical protein